MYIDIGGEIDIDIVVERYFAIFIVYTLSKKNQISSYI